MHSASVVSQPAPNLRLSPRSAIQVREIWADPFHLVNFLPTLSEGHQRQPSFRNRLLRQIEKLVDPSPCQAKYLLAYHHGWEPILWRNMASRARRSGAILVGLQPGESPEGYVQQLRNALLEFDVPVMEDRPLPVAPYLPIAETTLMSDDQFAEFLRERAHQGQLPPSKGPQAATRQSAISEPVGRLR